MEQIRLCFEQRKPTLRGDNWVSKLKLMLFYGLQSNSNDRYVDLTKEHHVDYQRKRSEIKENLLIYDHGGINCSPFSNGTLENLAKFSRV